ncbi:hypothetical protein SAMN05414137_107221 [Streptacidiphilus jiangxiensis]|uniref:Short chain dehydrogenase n=1 Tax=Streptacidiphilus jiangxiensis TaxID=235985 RepID=A0A1H7P4N4_STRJI|nr:hypothetical protein SAMN05414137_107221 [Streptacidiphilus jiangxiensis]
MRTPGGAERSRPRDTVVSPQPAATSRTAEEAGWPRWLNVPPKVAQVAAVRAVAAVRRDRDLAEGTLIASVCPGMVDTATSRPWFSDYSHAQSPARAAEAVLDLVTTEQVDPSLYGEPIRSGEAVGGTALGGGRTTPAGTSATRTEGQGWTWEPTPRSRRMDSRSTKAVLSV